MNGLGAIMLAGVFWASVGLFARFFAAYQLSPFYMVVLRTMFAVSCLGLYLADGRLAGDAVILPCLPYHV